MNCQKNSVSVSECFSNVLLKIKKNTARSLSKVELAIAIQQQLQIEIYAVCKFVNRQLFKRICYRTSFKLVGLNL